MIQLELQPQVEAIFVSEAAQRQVTVEAYVQELLTSLAEEESGLREGLADVEAGRVQPAREVFAELQRRYGIQG